MKEHAFCSGSACKKLLSTVSFLGWKLHGAVAGCANPVPEAMLNSREQRAEYFRRTQAVPEKQPEIPWLQHHQHLQLHLLCCILQAWNSLLPDSKDERLLTQVSSRVAGFTDWLPAISTFSRMFLLLFSVSMKLRG